MKRYHAELMKWSRIAGPLIAGLVVGVGCTSQVLPDEVPASRAEPELRIGSMDGVEEYLFGQISGIATDESGRIYVADHQTHDIRAFDEDGAYLFRVARRGGGPAEVMAPCCLAFGPDGLLWVRDTGNRRYVAFDVSGQEPIPITTQRMQHSDVNRFATTTFDGEGRLIDIGATRDRTTGESYTTLFHIRSGGGVERERRAPTPDDANSLVHDVTRTEGQLSLRFFLYPPFGPRHLIAYGPNGVMADAVSSRYEVRWFDEYGGLLRTIVGPNQTGPRLTAEQRVQADSMIAADSRRVNAKLPFDVPDLHPPITAIRFDQVGRLWVQKTVLPGEPRQVDVYGADGALVERIEYPTGLDLSYGVVRPDILIGVTRNEFDVQYVSLLRVQRQGNGQ